MHPENVGCITAAGIDCCVLANNHTLDWGRAGLAETLKTLRHAGVATAGAGEGLAEASAPAMIGSADSGRVAVFGYGVGSAGVPRDWAASADEPGVNVLRELSSATVDAIAVHVESTTSRGDIVVASIHWGPNWGYETPSHQRDFAHQLVDRAGVDVVHGHSSHHPKAIEVYRGKPILYGCGDLINDYEGIAGEEAYRGDLVLMYFVTLDARSGELVRLHMTPLQTHRFRLRHARAMDVGWLRRRLDREARRFGASVEVTESVLGLRW
jgi:poly-gamma-glutamate synthesis protein (capsule biosynthesis protein)